MGAHLITPRIGFAHHGIYVGRGQVIHRASFAHHWCRGAVEEVSLARFTRGRCVWARSHAVSRFGSKEVIDRARSRLGEQSYHLLTNNCEHFCEWCAGGEPRSYQVEELLIIPRHWIYKMSALGSVLERLILPRRFWS
jgi:hypothetical protein